MMFLKGIVYNLKFGDRFKSMLQNISIDGIFKQLIIKKGKGYSESGKNRYICM